MKNHDAGLRSLLVWNQKRKVSPSIRAKGTTPMLGQNGSVVRGWRRRCTRSETVETSKDD